MTQSAARWHPPSFDVKVEDVPIPKIIDPDDAIVKIELSGLCGSDLHIYRGHGAANLAVHTSGHEFLGTIHELGSSFNSDAAGRPSLYRTLKVGDKVISAFTVNCGECSPCRLGFTCRCIHSTLFGTPKLDGGQSQYVRVPKAGGTLFSLNDGKSWPANLSSEQRSKLADSSLLLLADILPTGLFAALQVLNHPKMQPAVTGRPWPLTFGLGDGHPDVPEQDRILTIAVVGLGPVGICSIVALLDHLQAQNKQFQIVAIDLNESRREKIMTIYKTLSKTNNFRGEFVAESPEGAAKVVAEWTDNLGCSAVLEIVGNPQALKLSYDLVRSFGVITSVGVHGPRQSFPVNGANLYDKNVSLDFGRCPARSMIPPAFELLIKRQDIFGSVGDEASLIEKILPLSDAREAYRAFDKGEVGKVLFKPWD